ncbi:MAG: hypothetical protein AB9891_09325 [Anaerolineaceae bacterium]
MMNFLRRGAALGVILIAAGILFLLSNLGYFDMGDYVIGGLFCLGGLFFLSMLREKTTNWWTIIPGVILFDLGGLIIFSSLFPHLMDRIGGAFFLGGVSLAFWLVYFRVREYWWAIIPAGVLLTLAAITVIDLTPFSGLIVPATLFLGIACTFALVYILTGRETRFRWTWYPAAITGIMGFIFLFFSGRLGGFVMPTVLIILGIYLVGKTLKKTVQ